MNPVKTIVATAVVAVGGTAAAFTGVHAGQSPAAAATAQPVAQPAQAAATYTVTMSAEDLAKLAALMNGQHAKTQAKTQAGTHTAAQHTQRTHQESGVHQQHQVVSTASASASNSAPARPATSRYSAGDGHGRCRGGSYAGGASHHGGDRGHD
jgi:hypothetical protein